jgi:outer membrane protein assembly factor BamB
LIADRLNGRLIAVNEAGAILWRFPVAGSIPSGQSFSADDAFVSPDGKSIVANEESNQIVVRIDIATEQIAWQYGTFGVKGVMPDQLSTPDDAYPLPNGDISVADIRNCRIIQIAPSGQIDSQWGTPGLCMHNPPTTFAQPNGDTPLPDGGVLVTEIVGSRVVRLSSTGQVVFDIQVPARYPSDAHLLPSGNVLVADYSNPGAVLVIDPATGATVYRYGPSSGTGRLNRPSLALPLPDGTYLVNDDYNHRVVVIDPTTSTIVWSYGHMGQPSAADGYLNLPDGVDVAPPDAFGPS